MTRRKQSQPMQRKTSADDEDAEDLRARGHLELELDRDEASSLHQRSDSESDDEQLASSGRLTSQSIDPLPPTTAQRDDEKVEPRTGSTCVSPVGSDDAEMSPPGVGERDEVRDSSPLRLRRKENSSPFNADRTESPRLDASTSTRGDRHPEGAVPDNTSEQPLTAPSTVAVRRRSLAETVAEQRDAGTQDGAEKGATGARCTGLLTEAAHSPVAADRRGYSAALDALKYSSPVDPLSSGLLCGSSVAKLESFVASVQADRKPSATMTSYPIAAAAAPALLSPLPPPVIAAVTPAVSTCRQNVTKSSSNKSKPHDSKHSTRSNGKQSKSTAASVTSAAARLAVGPLALTQSLDQPLDLSVKSKQQQRESNKYLLPDLTVGASSGGASSLANLERQFGKGAAIFDRIGTKAWAAPYCAAALRFGLAAGYPLGSGLPPPLIDPLALHSKPPTSTTSGRAKPEAESTNMTPRSTPRRPLASPADASALLLPWAQQLSTADQKRAAPAASSASTSGTTSSAGQQPIHTNFRCSCGASMESLYALTVHLQRTGHTPAVPSITNTPTASGSTSTDHSGSGGGSSTPATGSARPPEYSKLVRGQDVWLSGGGERTRRSILRCIECGESFRSLPELTVHMVHTRHYTNIVGGTTSGAAVSESAPQSSSSTSHRKSAGKSSQHHQHSSSGSFAAAIVPSASKAAPSPESYSSQSTSHSAGAGTTSSSVSQPRLQLPVDASTSRRRRQSSSTRLSSEHDDRSTPNSHTTSSPSPVDEKTTELATGGHGASSLWSPLLSGSGRSGGTSASQERRCAEDKLAADENDVEVEVDRISRVRSRESSESSDQRVQLSVLSPLGDKYQQQTGRKSTDSHASSPSPGLIRPPSGPDCSTSAIKAMEFFIRSSFGGTDSAAAGTSSSSKRPATPTLASPTTARPASTHHKPERESLTFVLPADGLFRNRYLPPKYDATADDEDLKPGIGIVGGKPDDMQPADLTTSRRTRELDREDEHRKLTFTVSSDKMNSDSKKCSPLTGSQAADSSTSSPADPSERSLEAMESENADGKTHRLRSDNSRSGYRKRRNVADDSTLETPVNVMAGLKSQSELAMKRQRPNRKSSSEPEAERPTSTSSSSGRRSALESLQGLVYGQSLNSEHPLDSLQRLIYGGAAAAGLLGVEHQHLQQQQQNASASGSSSSGAFPASLLTPQTLILVNPIVTLVSQPGGTATSISGPSLSIALHPSTAAAAATPTSADVTPRQNLSSGAAHAGGGRGGSAGESSGSSDSAADQAVPVPPQRVYRCRACRRKFSSKGSYRYHLSRCHLLASSTSPKAASEPPGVKDGRYQPSTPVSVSVADVTDVAVTLTSAKTSSSNSTPISVQQFGCIPLDGTARLQARYFAMDAEAK